MEIADPIVLGFLSTCFTTLTSTVAFLYWRKEQCEQGRRNDLREYADTIIDVRTGMETTRDLLNKETRNG